jgi:predicted ATPase
VDKAKLAKTPTLGSPFVDRTGPLTQFVEVWQQLTQGQGSSIWVSGEAGVGKSRLVRECVLYASGQGALTLRGNCYEMEGGLPYQPLIEAFREGLGKISDEVWAEIPERGLSQLVKLMPELEDRFPDLEVAAPLEATEQERNRLFEGLCQCLESLSKHAPVIVILDDVQWVEASTLEFIHFLVRQLPRMSVLLMPIYREGEVDEDHALHGVLQHLTRNDLMSHWLLEPLTAEDTEALVHGLLNTEALESVAASVYEESKGMPFFAEELVKSLIEAGALSVDADGQWQAQGTRLADDVVPSSIRALVGTRLRRLNRASKQVLELASVIGRSFSFDLLLEVMGPWQVELLKPVEDLLWARFLEDHDGRYRFQHDLVRQVIYQDLSPERKRQFHLRVAETLESQYEDAPNDPANAALPGEMATHFVEANKPKKALAYVLEAGRHAWFNTYAKEESLRLYQRALDLAESLNDEDKLMQAYKGLGEILSSTDEHDQGIAYSQKALGICEDPQERAEILCAIARGHHYKQDLEQALASCEQALAELGENASTLQAAKVYSYTGNFLNWLLRYDESIEQGKHALDILKNHREDRLKTLVLSQLGHAHSGLKDYDAASDYLAESVQLAEKTRDLGAISQSSFQLAMALYNTDKLTDAVAAWEKALDALQTMGDRHIEEAIQYNWLTFAHMRLGDLEQALTYAKLQLEKNKIAQREEGVANSQGMLGCLQDVLKKPKLSKSAFDKAFKLAPEDGRVYQGIIMSYLYMEQLDKAVGWLEKGESFLERRHIEYLNTCPTSSAFEAFRKNRKFKARLKAVSD